MLDVYFKNCSSNKVKNILVIDPIESDCDYFIKFLDLDCVDLSSNYNRGPSIYVNYLSALSYLKKYNLKDCLILGSDFCGLLEFDFFIERAPKENFLLLVTTKNRKHSSSHLCILNTPLNLSSKEFRVKLFAHLQKVIGGCFPEDVNNNFPEKHFTIAKLEDISNLKDNYFSGDVDLEGYKLDFIFKRDSRENSLIIINQAAVARNRNLPIFQRWKWVNDIKGSVLILNDPHLYKNDHLKATWWLGDRQIDTLKVFIGQLKCLLEKLDITSEKVFFYGSSAGGFAALQQVALLKEGTAIIDIAQTNLFVYKYKEEVDFVSKTLFGCPTGELEEIYHERFNAIERIKNEKGRVKVYVLQNTEDVHHLLHHAIPLVENLKKINNCEFKLLTYQSLHPSKGGHLPLSKKSTISFLNDIISYPGFCHNRNYLEKYNLKEEFF